MSEWETHGIEAKIHDILRDFRSNEPGHLGQPFLSSYQITIAFAKRYPKETATLGWPIGGAGTGQRNSLAQYIAGQLSQRISDKRITDIEGVWLHKEYVQEIKFTHESQPIAASLQQEVALSMFRLKD